MGLGPDQFRPHRPRAVVVPGYLASIKRAEGQAVVQGDHAAGPRPRVDGLEAPPLVTPWRIRTSATVPLGQFR